MGLLSKRETITHTLEFGTGPAALFNTFTNPQHGNAIFGTKTFAIMQGNMLVRAVYDTAPLARHIPLLAGARELEASLRIGLHVNPHRISSQASMNGIEQKSEIRFQPKGSGTLMTFESMYDVPLHLRGFAGGIRTLFSEKIVAAFTMLAELSADGAALQRLQAGALKAPRP